CCDCGVFFFQAEDGIRDRNVTGVQTCALPISVARFPGGRVLGWWACLDGGSRSLLFRRQASQRAFFSHEDRPMNIPFIRRLVGALGVVALLGGLASTGWAQQGQQGTITGVVTDQLNSLPVAGARILLGNTNRTVLTNATGRYTLAAVPAGSYELRVVAVGFASQTHGVQLAAGG